MNLFLIPLASAFICWCISTLTLFLLVYPTRPISFGFFSIQGVVPRHLSKLAKEVALVIAEDFPLEKWLNDKLESPELQYEISEFLEKRLDKLITVLKQQIPMGEMLITRSLTDRLKNLAKLELMKTLPELPNDVLSRISIPNIIDGLMAEKVGGSRKMGVSSIVKKHISKDLIWITVYSMLIGFVIGLFAAIYVLG